MSDKKSSGRSQIKSSPVTLSNIEITEVPPQSSNEEESQRYLGSLSENERRELAKQLGISFELLTKNLSTREGSPPRAG